MPLDECATLRWDTRMRRGIERWWPRVPTPTKWRAQMMCPVNLLMVKRNTRGPASAPPPSSPQCFRAMRSFRVVHPHRIMEEVAEAEVACPAGGAGRGDHLSGERRWRSKRSVRLTSTHLRRGNSGVSCIHIKWPEIIKIKIKTVVVIVCLSYILEGWRD